MINTKTVIVRPSKKSRQHYVDLGYSRHSKAIEVPVGDLHSNAMNIVEASCDDCGLVREVKFGQYRPFCPSCSRKGDRNKSWKGGKPKCVDCGEVLSGHNCKNIEVKRCQGCHVKWCVGENNPTYKKELHCCPKCNKSMARHSDICRDCWKGEIHNPDATKRSNMDYKWSCEVKELASYSCDSCGSTDSLNAHHLESFTNNEPLRRKLSNGVCLCRACHLDFHKAYGFGDNTTEQYLEFKESRNGCN